MEPTGIYRPGYPFTSVELQTMVHHGVLRHVIADVYAEAHLPQTAQLRATVAYALLNTALRRRGILCGQTAAWVHLGTAPADRIAVIAPGTSPRQTASSGRWQLHQTTLGAADTEVHGPMRVTTALRTAADLFCGTGVQGCRKALDRISVTDRTEQSLLHWPAVHMPLQERDENLVTMGPADRLRVQQRWKAIAALCKGFGLEADELADTVLRILSRKNRDTGRRDRIARLLDHCVWRRLPTVR